jgi:hypothetical protein
MKPIHEKEFYSKYGYLVVDRADDPEGHKFILRVKDRPGKAFLVSRLTLVHHNYIADTHLQPL